MGMHLGDLASKVGKGLFAGVMGTALMTASTMIEMQLRDRPSSTTPADAVSKVFEIQPANDQAKQRLSNVVHWGYGTSWGSVRGLIDAAGVQGPAAALLHFAAVWGSALVMLPGLKVTPPVSEWGDEELAVDGFHHMVYAVAASVAYHFLDKE
jgi:hypothetical protein